MAVLVHGVSTIVFGRRDLAEDEAKNSVDNLHQRELEEK
jgi:hypothetical protein